MSAEWNGEGGPPNGSVCRVDHYDKGEFVRVKVVFRNSGYVWLRLISSHHENVVWVESDVVYSPIRSAEEVAVEAMREAVSSDNGKPSRRQVCRDIYAAIRDGKIPGVKLED